MPYVRGYTRRAPRSGWFRERRPVRVRGYHRSRPHSMLVAIILGAALLLLLLCYVTGVL